MKKMLIILASVSFLNASSISGNNSTIKCKLAIEEPFSYTGDVSGKRLYTKKEFTYNCVTTKKIKGTCKTYKEQREDINLNKMKKNPVYYKTENFEGSMGEMLSVTQAYDKINGMWAGWHGICQKGMDDDNFAWMTDPYVLAGYALSAISAGYAASASSAATTADAAKQAATSATDAANSNLSSKALEEVAKKARDESLNAAEDKIQTEATQRIVKMSVCAASAGLDTAKMVTDYLDDGEPCDPIDEICNEEKNGASNEGNVFTIKASKYENMLKTTPEMADYCKIVDGEGTEILSVIITNSTKDTSSMSTEEAKEAKKTAKRMKLKVEASMTTVQTAQCMASGTASSVGSKSGDESITSAKNLTKMALGTINPLLGVAADVVFNTYDSLQPINTCDIEEDAKDKGSRHEATYHALKHGFCHLIEANESGGVLSKRTKYRYCCYNDKTTRIMVEQSKAQLAKDWTHCTDISPDELAYLSFKSCDPDQLDASVDGVYLDNNASQEERDSAYQHVHQCIDTREYIADMMKRFGGNNMMLDDTTLLEMLKDLK